MRSIGATAIAFLVLVCQAGLVTAHDGPTVVQRGDDYVVPPEPGFGGSTTQATDPLGLLPALDLLRVFSRGTDRIDVWTCDLGTSVGSIVAQLDSKVVPYFTTHSRGRITVDFIAKGAATGGEGACLDTAAAGASASANGAMVIGPWSGGLGGPGDGTSSWPANDRWALVGIVDMATTAAHEYGHMQFWPHSFTKASSDEYDNALDVMSGNYGTDGNTIGGWPLPYDTAVINRYAAGWIDPDQVRILDAAASTFRLEPSSGNGIQMAVIKAGSKYYTLGARHRSTYDPIPAIWQGVEVYEVTPCPSSDPWVCWSDPRFQAGFREIVPFGKVPFRYWDPAAYTKALPQVIGAGKSKTVGGRTISVSGYSSGGYSVTVSGTCTALYVDICGSTFRLDIEWLAAAGVTKGCNAANTKFCPNDAVTRGQMAAFLHRALPGLPLGPTTDFIDDDGSTFEADIEWLAAAGVTKGCNAANTKFCPKEVVTRGQMAAFLHRALGD